MTARIWRNWEKWKRIRTKILERDKHTCQSCKVTIEELARRYRRKKRLLIVHHIIPAHRKGDDDLEADENLITLCYTCHYRAAFIGSETWKLCNDKREKLKREL